MTRRLTGCLLAVALIASGPVFSQEIRDPAATPDPLAQRVGEEMARGEAAEGAVGELTPEDDGATLNRDRVLRTTAALFIVLALILVGSYGLRRWGKRVPILAGAHLGKVLGRLYLDRGTALHFVQVGDKVLLIGANANSISLIGELPAGFAGDAPKAGRPAASAATAPFNPDSFLAELRARSQDLAASERLPRAEEDEIANLRGDIHRLQRYLRDENREPGD